MDLTGISMIYHNVVINLCAASIARPKSTTSHPRIDLQKTSEHSAICFETLLRLYYLRHSFQSADAYLIQPMLETGFAAIRRLKAMKLTPAEIDAARGALTLAAKGLIDQGKIYQIHHTVFHVLAGEMSEEDSSLTHRLLDIRNEDNSSSQMRAKHVQAQYVCNIVDITEDPEQQRLGNLIAKYDKLAVKEASPSPSSGSSTA